MKNNTIRIEHIKVCNLSEFANQLINAARPGQFIPISMQRAIAHTNNPYADEEDVGLLVARDEDDEVVGYFGILPMMLRVNDKFFNTHWFTTWSVSTKVRGMGVGSKLMEEALTLNKDFLIVGSIHARRVCQKNGFLERDPLTYYWIDVSGMGQINPLIGILRLYRKINHILKNNKHISISNSTTKWIDKQLSPWTKRFFYPLLSRKLTKFFDKFKYTEVHKIRSGQERMHYSPDVELYRGIEAVNWMLEFPWVVETGQSRTEHLDYFFSDTRPLHRFIAFEITDNFDAYQGFVVFSISQKEGSFVLKTLDFQFKDSNQHPWILALAVHYGKKFKVDTIEIPWEAASYLQTSLLGKTLLQEKTRIYQCHPKSNDSPLAGAWHDINLHLFDGDMAFS